MATEISPAKKLRDLAAAMFDLIEQAGDDLMPQEAESIVRRAHTDLREWAYDATADSVGDGARTYEGACGRCGDCDPVADGTSCRCGREF